MGVTGFPSATRVVLQLAKGAFQPLLLSQNHSWMSAHSSVQGVLPNVPPFM